MHATCVILAAGRSERFGTDKTAALLDGRTLLEHVVAAAEGFEIVGVASPSNAHLFAHLRHVVNPAPERGMSHSLQLANAAVDAQRALIVLLADMPFVSPRAVRAVAAALADGYDVAYPWDGSRAGHPVGFGTVARAAIDALAPGDTLRILRDSPALRALRLPLADPGLSWDIDVPADLERRPP